MMETYTRRQTLNKDLEKSYWWIFGGKGGFTRCQIINLLLDRPYNAYQIAQKLGKSYNNIKYHLRVLMKEYLIKSDSRQYSAFYYVSKDFNVEIYKKIYKLIVENEQYLLKRSKLRSLLRRMKKEM
ncbi:MAG: winged helix-turn-helix domain-containing protein [Candidatus Helarchaeota archaeon]